VNIPDAVTSIEESAFHQCESLTSVVIPNSVINIEGSAFWGCKKLATIFVPNSVKKIGKDAFYHSGRTPTIQYDGTMREWKKLSVKKTLLSLTYTVKCTDGEIKVNL
jgi:hypothetical protein